MWLEWKLGVAFSTQSLKSGRGGACDAVWLGAGSGNGEVGNICRGLLGDGVYFCGGGRCGYRMMGRDPLQSR
jgi:hypothetical protein